MHSRGDDLQDAPTAAYLSEPGSFRSRQLPTRENRQSTLLRFRAVLCRAAFLRGSQICYAQAENHPGHRHEEFPRQVRYQRG